MALADGVQAFDLTVSRDGQEATVHPGAVETEHGLLLLDVGYPDTLDQIEAQLSAIGHGWADVWGVLLTHQDADHVAGLAEEDIERTLCFHGGLVERGTGTIARRWQQLADDGASP